MGRDGATSVNSINYFTNIAIPQGSSILSATLEYGLAESGGGTVNMQLAAENTASAVAPTDASQFSAKQSNLTTARVNWNAVPHGDWGSQITSPDIAPVIQELVNRDDWESGNAINMWIGDNGSQNFAHSTYFTVDCNGCGKLPTLTITYTSGDSPTPSPTPTSTPTSTPIVTPTPTASPTPSSSPTPSPTPIPGTTDVTIPITYSSLDLIYFHDLTLIADVGTVTSATVSVDGDIIPSTYDPETGRLMFTTTSAEPVMHLVDVPDVESITVTKAPLKDNKKWAWSIGFDDNVYLKNSVDILESYGWKGLFYLIGDTVHPTRDEPWIVDKPYLVNKLNNGWSLGNHTMDHNCTSASESTVIQGYNIVKDIVDSSAKTDYKIIAFAAPCFLPGYNTIVTAMRTAHEYEVLFNESQGSGLMIINPGASNYTASGTTASAATSNTIQIGRDGEIDWAPENVMARMDWMSAQATSSRNFWLNTYLHGSNEANLTTVSTYVYTNYGPDGTDEVWMAPPDEVYSYLMVRDNAEIGTLIVD